MEYKILQMRRGDDLHFMRFEAFNNLVKELKVEYYNEVYKSYVVTVTKGSDPYAILGYLFEKFNLHCPEDFRGHSLSVSDIIKLGDDYYYCDSYGWKQVKEENGVFIAA